MPPPYEMEVRLRWGDSDAYGHVNHLRGLAPFEDARLALAAEVEQVPAGTEAGVIVARLEVDYRRQLHYRAGEALALRTWVTRVGTKSVALHQELAQDGEVAIAADVVLVMFDFAAGASRQVTEAERARWARYQKR